MPVKTGIVLFAHGSSVESANQAVRSIAALVATEGGFELMETAFLELGKPDLPAAIDLLAARQAEQIVVVPYFLTLGIHLKRDLPRILDGCRLRHPGIAIAVTEPLDGHPALRQIVIDRVNKAKPC